jgi:uncharacterized phage protein gp47/JayE
VYGSDVTLDTSSQDYQWLAIQAQAIYDTNQTIIFDYGARSPSTAVGAGLSSVVKINGIARLVASNSTAAVTLIGQAGKTVANGMVGDNLNLGTQWTLPVSVTFPSGGSITVTATCTTPGAITAAAGTLTVMLTPTAGWQSVTNAIAATAGAPVEQDATLRQRQTVSTAIPSNTVIAGITGALRSVTGVTTVMPYENPTDVTDANGIPPHSVAFVVAGGDLQAIVNVIGAKKTPGTNTYGNTSGVYIDPTSGIPNTIHFSVPVPQTISIALTIHELEGYSSVVGAEIQATLAAYVSATPIGGTIMIARLYVPAQLEGPWATIANTNDPYSYELTSIGAAVSPVAPGAADVHLLFNQSAVCAVSNVALTVT